MDNVDKNLLWHEVSRRQTADCRIYTVDGVTRRSADGFEREFYVINSNDWAVVIPVLKKEGKDYCVLVRQFRHGLNDLTLEFPSGIIENNEPPAAAAARELWEETGFKAGKLTYLGSDSPNGALFNNKVHTFIAEELTDTQSLHLDESERIAVVTKELSETLQHMGTKPYSGGAIMNNALLRYYRYRKII
jgi:ADP-ribose pyrophosphatase